MTTLKPQPPLEPGSAIGILGGGQLGRMLALAAANLHPHAFQAAVYTEDIDTVYAAYDAFDASAVMVNDHTAFRDDAMPFAGLSASGLGVGGIPYTIEEMQFEKMLVLKQD